jgi:hypothetical protein
MDRGGEIVPGGIPPSMKIPWVYVEKKEGNIDRKKLLETGSEQLFLIDMDGIRRGRMNYQTYTEYAKYFELIVMNYPTRLNEFIDTLISGATSVVIPSDLKDSIISDFLDYSGETVLVNTDPEKSASFSEMGGNLFLSEWEVRFPHRTVYYYGNQDLAGYVRIADFPYELLRGYL